MTSKEALEQLNIFISREKHINSEKNKIVNDCVSQIKQALERLEVLEKNSDKVIKDSVNLINKNLELQQTNEKLEKDNNTLEALLSQTKIDYVKTLSENEKLKKVIEFLKNKLTVEIKQHICSDSYYLDYSDYCYVDSNLTQQEYDLLKEVLGDA